MGSSDQPIEQLVVAVDVVCFSLHDTGLQVLGVLREHPPFAGTWALPGAALRLGETLDEAAARVVAERAHLDWTYLEQLYTFSHPRRDPRGRTLTVAYYGIFPAPAAPDGQGRWWPVHDLPTLAFDHADIVRYARARIADKLHYTPIAFRFLPETFTLSELRRVYEAVEGRAYPHLSNFATVVRARWPLARVGEVTHGGGRPAQRYRYVGPGDISGPPAFARDGGAP